MIFAYPLSMLSFVWEIVNATIKVCMVGASELAFRDTMLKFQTWTISTSMFLHYMAWPYRDSSGNVLIFLFGGIHLLGLHSDKSTAQQALLIILSLITLLFVAGIIIKEIHMSILLERQRKERADTEVTADGTEPSTAPRQPDQQYSPLEKKLLLPFFIVFRPLKELAFIAVDGTEMMLTKCGCIQAIKTCVRVVTYKQRQRLARKIQRLANQLEMFSGPQQEDHEQKDHEQELQELQEEQQYTKYTVEDILLLLEAADDFHKNNCLLSILQNLQNESTTHYWYPLHSNVVISSDDSRTHDEQLLIPGLLHCSHKELVRTALLQNGGALQFAHERVQNDKDIVLVAVTKCGEALQYASTRLQNDEQVVRAAVKQNGIALQYAGLAWRSDQDMVMEAMRSNGLALEYVSALALADETDETNETDETDETTLQCNKDIVMEAVQQSGAALRFASVALRNDPDIVLEAVAQDGDALQFASAILQKEKRIRNMAKVSHEPFALDLFTKLKDDREFVMIALKKSGIALQYCSRNLQNDEGVVLAAMEQDVMAYKYRGDYLREGSKRKDGSNGGGRCVILLCFIPALFNSVLISCLLWF